MDKSWTKITNKVDPYWHKLLMGHNIDVMHLEKNVCENLLGTLLNIDKKTKDTGKARLNLEDMNIRKDLHLVKKGDRWFKPHAPYVLTSNNRKKFCNLIKSVRFPDGFAGNLAKNVIVEQDKMWIFMVMMMMLPKYGTSKLVRQDPQQLSVVSGSEGTRSALDPKENMVRRSKHTFTTVSVNATDYAAEMSQSAHKDQEDMKSHVATLEENLRKNNEELQVNKEKLKKSEEKPAKMTKFMISKFPDFQDILCPSDEDPTHEDRPILSDPET